MAGSTEIIQSRFGSRLRFKFEFDRVHFWWRDLTGERGFSVAYDGIDLQNPGTLVFNNVRFARRLLALPILLFGIGIVSDIYSDVIAGTICALSLLVFLGICLAHWRRQFAVRFILFDLSTVPSGSGGHPIRVIEDEQANAIISQLKIGRERQIKVNTPEGSETVLARSADQLH